MLERCPFFLSKNAVDQQKAVQDAKSLASSWASTEINDRLQKCKDIAKVCLTAVLCFIISAAV
jgi:hypothetical protein